MCNAVCVCDDFLQLIEFQLFETYACGDKDAVACGRLR